MGKPRMIILVRHAQSEGNKNRDIHQTTPDHRVKLTSEGYRQAQEAGRKLRDLLRPDDTLHFFTSPYRRTRETTEGILESLTSDSPHPSPFSRNTIRVYEEPRLREQDFGNFQPCSTEMERMWMERADYGHFFYRIPNGESAADAYDRVSGFNESLWRLFGDEDSASVCVIVTHGLMTRVFLMKWYHWSVEYFEDLRNINHCEFVIMTHNEDNGKYTLQNNLRTWSDLRKERDAEKKREREAQGLSPTAAIVPAEHVPTRRKWGGCPDGCNHGLSADAKKSLRVRMVETMRYESGSGSNKEPLEPKSATSASSKDTDRVYKFPNDNNAQHASNADEDNENSESDHAQANPRPEAEAEEAKRYRTGDSSSDIQTKITRPARPALQGLHHSEDHLLHPPAMSSSTTNLKLALLHLRGRDGGGSMSGANSLAPSDDEGDDHNPTPQPVSGYLQPKTVLNRPSQDAEDDGDDELSAAPTEEMKRVRLHSNHYTHHHNHYHHHSLESNNHVSHHRHSSSTNSSQPPHRMANILGDGDDVSTHSDGHSPEPSYQEHETKPRNNETRNGSGPEQETETHSLEEQQREDQSVRGSIY
ncbi:Histidine phosphatase superfamily clade-1 [Penicillium verhagenii]|uniref:Histidine phosphatase superfamily clade-1 n=1 Tax=Penicillium verhagenii TaxID=1562060 RepID=UPI0025458228|nr:Histidine phosphatase superfamily clade-1 [Penicillium verhagenii]KAJ5924831.1 Histidine phosphatase superfamily clade-1 [Penicillium verhagenii]